MSTERTVFRHRAKVRLHVEALRLACACIALRDRAGRADPAFARRIDESCKLLVDVLVESVASSTDKKR